MTHRQLLVRRQIRICGRGAPLFRGARWQGFRAHVLPPHTSTYLNKYADFPCQTTDTLQLQPWPTRHHCRLLHAVPAGQRRDDDDDDDDGDDDDGDVDDDDDGDDDDDDDGDDDDDDDDDNDDDDDDDDDNTMPAGQRRAPRPHIRQLLGRIFLLWRCTRQRPA